MFQSFAEFVMKREDARNYAFTDDDDLVLMDSFGRPYTLSDEELEELRVQYAESVHRHAKAVATRKLHEQMAKEQLDLFGEDDG